MTRSSSVGAPTDCRQRSSWSAQGGLTIQKDHGEQITGDFNDPNLNLNRYGAIDQDSEFVIRMDATYSCLTNSRPR